MIVQYFVGVFDNKRAFFLRSFMEHETRIYIYVKYSIRYIIFINVRAISSRNYRVLFPFVYFSLKRYFSSVSRDLSPRSENIIQ